jgi:hypothetical protein
MSIAHTCSVWPCDLDAAQQIWIDLVSWLRLRRARTAIERFYPRPPHQRLQATAAGRNRRIDATRTRPAIDGASQPV